MNYQEAVGAAKEVLDYLEGADPNRVAGRYGPQVTFSPFESEQAVRAELERCEAALVEAHRIIDRLMDGDYPKDATGRFIDIRPAPFIAPVPKPANE